MTSPSESPPAFTEASQRPPRLQASPFLASPFTSSSNTRHWSLQIIILAGGSGTRFWPLSRRQRPKQFLSLEGGTSLLQQTCSRLEGLADPEDVWVCTTERLAPAVREQLPQVPAHQVLAEPQGRNTAAAIGWSVSCIPESLREGAVAVLPADHRMADGPAFRQVLDQARQAVEERDLVLTLGIRPHRAETGYGYLELGEVLDQGSGLRRVSRFREKPDLATAESYVSSGNFLWNGGIFVFRGTTLLSLLEHHQPELSSGLKAIAAEPHRLAELYAELPSTSIDYGLMEKIDVIGTLPLDCGWSDLGSWQALWEVAAKDDAGNAFGGPGAETSAALQIAARDNLVWSEGAAVALVGVEGLAVVNTGDAILVMPREQAQEVKAVVERLAAQQREDLL
ncbi:MAG: mannose-1-phosphate guanylyltransferase [Acidobacteriota bacterium]